MNAIGRQRKTGYTLIEMLVVISLVGMIVVLISMFVGNSWRSYRRQSNTIMGVEAASSALRNFEITTRAASTILTATPNELKFYRFDDLSSAFPNQVRYFVDGNQFKVGVTEPYGTAPNITYPAENEVIKLVINKVTNTTELFKYYSGNNIELNPVTISSIRMIQLTLKVNMNEVNGSVVGVETRVSLRNMKDNL